METKKASDPIINPNSGLGVPQIKDYTAPLITSQDMTLTDVQKADPEQRNTEIGRSGVLIMNGFIIGEEYDQDLVGRTGAKKFDQMRRSDSSIQAGLKALKLPILASQWEVQVPEDEDNALGLEKKEFIEKNLFKNLNFKYVLREALTCLEFGFSIFEKTYKMTDGKVELDKFGFRKQYSIYRWNMGDGQPGIQQYLLSGGFRNIPDYKVTLFSPEKEGDNYAGISVLRSCYKDWYMKDLLVKINAMSHERHGIGIPKITMKGTVSPDETKNMREFARNMRAGEESYVETTENLDVEILDMKASSRQDILPSIEFHTKQIFQSILAQFLQLSQSSSGGGTGSKALSEDMSKLFMRSLEYLSDYVAYVFNEDVIKDLIELNWGVGSACPKLVHEKVGDENIALVADAYSKYAQAGALTNTLATEKFIRSTIGLPPLTEEEEANYSVGIPVTTQASEMRSVKALNEKLNKIVGA